MRAETARRIALGLASGLAAAAVFELARPRGGPGRLVDWDAVREHALARAAGDRVGGRDRARLEARYAALAAEMRRPLQDTVGGPEVAMPPFQALGRADWAEVNLEVIRRVLEPLLSQSRVPDSRLVRLGRAGVDRYTGLMLGFLSTRVLGQFDPQLMGREPVSTALYLVETNVAEWEREAGLPGDDLRRWLILHEMTHAWQFAAHGWLAGFLTSALEDLLALGMRDGGSRLRRGLAMTVGLPSQWRSLQRVQAAMTLIEGYSNLVMNLAGREHIAAFEQLEAAYRRRSSEKSVLEVLFLKVSGLDLKLQQYRRGEAFCQAVYDARGMEALNLAWTSAETLPTMAELARPQAWIDRVVAPARPARARGRRAPSPA